MPIGPGSDAARGYIADVIKRQWHKYQNALPGWATEEYGMPDIGGGFTDNWPSTGGAMLEGGYNTLRDLTSVNPSIDIPIGIAALATGGGALLARGGKHMDEAARAYKGLRPGRGSSGIPHTSALPNEMPPVRMDPRGGFADNAAGSIRGDVDLSTRPNDFAAMDELGDIDQGRQMMADIEAAPDYSDPATFGPPPGGFEPTAMENFPNQFDYSMPDGSQHSRAMGKPYNAVDNPMPIDEWERQWRAKPPLEPDLPSRGQLPYEGGEVRQIPQHGQIQDPYVNQYGQQPYEDIEEFWQPQHPEDFPSDDMSWMDPESQGLYFPEGVDGSPEAFDYRGDRIDPTMRRAEAVMDQMDRQGVSGGIPGDPVISPQADGQIMQAFEELLQQGVDPEQAIELISLQFGDLL